MKTMEENTTGKHKKQHYRKTLKKNTEEKHYIKTLQKTLQETLEKNNTRNIEEKQ